jgi:hypothetical protein
VVNAALSSISGTGGSVANSTRAGRLGELLTAKGAEIIESRRGFALGIPSIPKGKGYFV